MGENKPQKSINVNKNVQTPTNRRFDNGDNAAEDILRDALDNIKKLIIVFSIMIGGVIFVGGIIGCIVSDNGLPLIICLVMAFITMMVGFGLARLIWAAGMNFVNISTNVRAIKQMILGKNEVSFGAYDIGIIGKVEEKNLINLARNGDLNAMDKLGVNCCVKQEYESAFQWFKIAAERGYADSQFHLGGLYEEGKGVTQNIAKALEWYVKAAEQGYEDAKIKIEEIQGE
ncbi:MAG: sel1 repeat family protein [Muribaculaceae bacterium]|nr:sel1 repeat family protein [Muribaculaceae bacterium]